MQAMSYPRYVPAGSFKEALERLRERRVICISRWAEFGDILTDLRHRFCEHTAQLVCAIVSQLCFRKIQAAQHRIQEKFVCSTLDRPQPLALRGFRVDSVHGFKIQLPVPMQAHYRQ